MLTKCVDKRSLIAADIMHVDFVKAEVDKALDVGTMFVDIGRNQHAVGEVFGADEFGDFGEIFGAADVLFGEWHTAVWPFGHGVLDGFFVCFGPRHVELQQFGHRAGVFADGFGAIGEFAEEHFEFFGGSTWRDYAITFTPCPGCGNRAGGGDIDGRRAIG